MGERQSLHATNNTLNNPEPHTKYHCTSGHASGIENVGTTGKAFSEVVHLVETEVMGFWRKSVLLVASFVTL